MLTITIQGDEYWDAENEEFVFPDAVTLELEHSLVSLSKWESIHEKPLLGPKPMTEEQAQSYAECMILTPNFPRGVLSQLSQKNLQQINDYINAKMTATWFSDTKTPPSREVITSELIYYWMFSFDIPIECENWHLNRLMTLLRVFNLKNTKQKPKSRAETLREQRELNERRKRELGTSG